MNIEIKLAVRQILLLGFLSLSLSLSLMNCSNASTNKSDSNILSINSKLDSIVIFPPNFHIANGTTQQFTATGTYEDNSKQDITTSVTWSSSDTFIAAIDSKGLTNGITQGDVTITAALDSVSKNTSLSVTAAELVSIDITPKNFSIPLAAYFSRE